MFRKYEITAKASNMYLLIHVEKIINSIQIMFILLFLVTAISELHVYHKDMLKTFPRSAFNIFLEKNI